MIKVSSTNPVVKGEPSAVRVYKDGKKIAEIFVTKRSPLKYLKSLSRSKHFKELEKQLLPHGVLLSDIGLSKSQRNLPSLRKVKCIVPISGGKDSQCCLKLAIEEFGSDNVMGLFCDTKFEHPLTYKHVEKLETLYGQIYIHRVSGGNVLDKSRKYNRFPGGGARHCTDELKIRETRIFLKDYSERFGEVQVWYGMRTDESSERAKRYEFKDPDELYLPNQVLKKYPKYLGDNGVRYKLPIVDWYTSEVMEYLEGDHNPLYDEGFDRVGCFPCLASGDKWKIKAFEHDDFGKQQLIDVRIVEEEIGKSVFTAKIGQAWDDNSQGCRVCEI